MPAVRLLVRHAQAGSSDQWSGDDRERPLDEAGRRETALLPELLRDRPITRIISSPYRRCVETVEPLASARGLAVETRDELGDDAPWEAAHALLAEAPDDSVLCSHGRLIGELVGDDQAHEKGSVWLLERRGDGFHPTDYRPAPSDG